jgi:hypothetical protein
MSQLKQVSRIKQKLKYNLKMFCGKFNVVVPSHCMHVFLGFCDNRDIKNDLGQRWLWIGKRPSNLFRVTISSLRMIGLPAPFLSYDL